MTLRDELAERLRGAVTIVGVGNPARGDDAFGPLLARELEGKVGARVLDAEDIPESYLGPILASRPDAVLFLDAVDLGEAPGAVALLDGDAISGYTPSTHRMPLSMLMEIVERETGARTAVLAAQPRQVELGRAPGAEIGAAVSCLAELLADVLPAPGGVMWGPKGAERAASW